MGADPAEGRPAPARRVGAGDALREAYACCELCPRRCRVNRREGQRGYCRAGAVAEVYRYGPHHGEEPPVSGTGGSGTVFFSRCTLRCRYCQNYPWSQEGAGTPHAVGPLSEALETLRRAGCHNWNLVSPTPWLPDIVEAVAAADAHGARLPIVYNTSGYERVDVLRALEGWVDVYLPDLRYARGETAREASGAPDYVTAARAALEEMWRQTGPLRVGPDGLAVRGMIVRLLVLPGHAEEAVESLRWLRATMGRNVALSVMAQYTPAYRALDVAPWNRKVTAEEYRRVTDAVGECGFEGGWAQEYEAETAPSLLGYRMPEGSGVAGAEAGKESRLPG